MANGIRTDDPRGFNKGRSSKFRFLQTPEESRRMYRPKRSENNNKDEDNSPKTLNDKNNQASSQKFWQLVLVSCKICFVPSTLSFINPIKYSLGVCPHPGIKPLIIYHLDHHHHVALLARISLTFSGHMSLSSTAPGKFSRLFPVSTQNCCM